MGRSGRRLVAVLGLLCAAAAAHAEFDSKGWAWRRPIDTGGKTGFVRVPVPPEIFAESRPYLEDLRVIGPGNDLVPHIVVWGRTQPSQVQDWRAATLLNPTYEPHRFQRVVLDFGAPVEKNLLRVGVSGSNFRRKAVVEGSTDSMQWESLGDEKWLFDVVTPERTFTANTIDLPQNNFRYLRLTVFHMPDDPERISIDRVEVSMQREVAEDLVSHPVRRIAAMEDLERRATVTEFDLGTPHLPLAVLEPRFSTPFFERAYELLGRNSTTQTVERRSETGSERREEETPWTHVRSGVLYRITDGEKTSEDTRIGELNAPFRYLKLVVFNADNPPLRLEEAQAKLRKAGVVF
jgi:hypothetical protein